MNLPSENTTDQLLQTHQRAKLFLLFGLPILAAYGIAALRNANWPLVCLIAANILVIGGSYLALLRGRDRPSTARPGMFTYAALLLYMIAFSGEEHSHALWFFSFPLVSIMLLPLREGAIWAGLGIASATCIMVMGGPETGTSSYSMAFTSRFTITAILIAGFSWFFKKSTLGISMRAVSDDQLASMSIGISIPRVFGLAWAAAGQPSQPREQLQLCALADGGALLTGEATTSEVYDAVARAWQPAGRAVEPRVRHAVIPLPDGGALVIGGDSTWWPSGCGRGATSTRLGTVRASVERWDPASREWSSATVEQRSRWYHTTTRLDDGRLLVTGGTYAGGPRDSAAIHDPTSRAWSTAPRMHTARDSHTATILPDGKVLVAGGLTDEGRSTVRAEVFDPAAGIWTDTGALHAARHRHAAVALDDGRVLVMGGCGTDASGTKVVRDSKLSPRLSATWDPKGDGRTVVRLNGGLFYARVPGLNLARLDLQPAKHLVNRRRHPLGPHLLYLVPQPVHPTRNPKSKINICVICANLRPTSPAVCAEPEKGVPPRGRA